MKKKIKFISIIFTFLFIISISVNESNSFSQFKNTLAYNTSLENTENIILLAPEGNSNTVSPNTEEGKTSDISNTTDNSGNGNVTNSSGSGETENNSNETGNNGSNAGEPTTPTEPATPSVPTEPTTPSEVVIPVEPTIPKQSEQQSTPANTNTGATGNTTNSSVKSSTGSSTSTSSTKKKTSSGTSSSTSSNSSTSTAKSSDEDTTTQNEVVTDSTEQITAPVNNENNAQELAKDQNQITIKSSLSKGDIDLDSKSNEIKLTSDNGDLKEIYYVFSNKKSADSNENWIKYSSPLKFDKKGTWYIHYKAVDKNGKESYGSFGPYNVSSKYETLEAGAADNSLNKKIIGFSMIAVIIILAVIYIVKTNRSPYSKLKSEDNYRKRKMFNFKFK